MPDTPPPPPANFKNPIPADQLAFLRDYADKSLKEIQKDKRFKNLEKQITPSVRYFTTTISRSPRQEMKC